MTTKEKKRPVVCSEPPTPTDTHYQRSIIWPFATNVITRSLFSTHSEKQGVNLIWINMATVYWATSRLFFQLPPRDTSASEPRQRNRYYINTSNKEFTGKRKKEEETAVDGIFQFVPTPARYKQRTDLLCL